MPMDDKTQQAAGKPSGVQTVAAGKSPLPRYYYWLLIFLILCVSSLLLSCDYTFNYYYPTYLKVSKKRKKKITYTEF